MENKVEQIRERVKALVNEAIELLEKEYDMDNARHDDPAFQAMLDLNNVLIEIELLDDEGLKLKD